MGHKMDQDEMEAFRRRAAAALKANQGNVRRTAMSMELTLRNLYFKLDRLKEEGMGLDPNDFRPMPYRRAQVVRGMPAGGKSEKA